MIKRYYFIILLLLPIALLFVSSNLYMEKQLQSWMEERIADELLQGAEMVKGVLVANNPGVDIATVDTLIDEINKNSTFRITIVNSDGTVIADSKLTITEVSAIENHGRRPEILAATADHPGISIRYSNTLHVGMMYLAIPYQTVSNKGFVRVAITLSKTEKYITNLRGIQTTVAIMGFLLMMGIVIIAFRYLQHINDKYKKELESTVEDRTDDLIKIQKLSHMLSSCQNISELSEVVISAAPAIFPATSGALSITHPSMDQNEVVASWGENWSGSALYSPTECWAFRRGSPYISNSRGMELKCKHMQSDASTICVPLLAQGVAVGALHIILPGDVVASTQDMFITIADHLSMALANINLRESLKRQAVRDPLTNLYNRRYLDEVFAHEIQRAKRHQHTIGVLMIDVDHFKNFNDSFGHDAGDHVLQVLSQLMNKIIRAEDIACRYGGEEFMLLMPDASLAVVTERANHLLFSASETELNFKEKSLGYITLSIGIAMYPDQGDVAESLISSADHALYQAKKNGRNQIQIAAIVG